MFVEMLHIERLSISPEKENVPEALLAELKVKIPGRQLGCEGVALFPVGIESISDITIYEGVLYPLVAYKLVAYRAFPGEILKCVVEKQDATGVYLRHPLIPEVLVPSSQLPVPSQLETLPGKSGKYAELWAWKYDGALLYIRPGDLCKVRVIKTVASGTVYADISESGLGPLGWW
ncbi:DNA-directed RNA polymerase III subunit RPC8 [Nematocida homosporus]|uniref:DNA-directed RNA polymerase III subunit RPC8 n=1 Tax=Nematocida homosporus TaxID=1912981 RepID=UPI0022202886|nr:DNA-directed RNA polymerase III subunit RPC8 [Nematocida homosporus]KAI5185219.1 DNA-directed RNA polymerase III subunit RPC8 [Nematocida homosporus]